MRNLKDVRTVAHHWANRVSDSGKASSLSFQGDTLYSYAEPIARLLADGTVLHTTQKWSVTTSAHQSLARAATNYSRGIFVRRVQDTPAENMRYAREWIAQTLARTDLKPSDYKKDGTVSLRGEARVAKLKADALHEADQANAYLTACQRNGLGVGELPIDTTDLEGVRVELEREEARRVEQRRLAQERAADEAKEHLVSWRAGNSDSGHFHLHNLPVALRLHTYMPATARNLQGVVIDPAAATKQVIQTSHGAEIPVEDAKRLWPLLLKVRAAGAEWVPTDTSKERRLGVYTLNAVRADGGIRVGCHEIAFAEMEAMAEQLGLTEKETT